MLPTARVGRPGHLPIGFGGDIPGIATEQLQPGDRVLFFTDGLVEQEAADGQQLGFGRLADHVQEQSAARLDCAETVRRIAAALLKPEAGLRDDATLLIVEWKGRSERRRSARAPVANRVRVVADAGLSAETPARHVSRSSAAAVSAPNSAADETGSRPHGRSTALGRLRVAV